MKMKYLERARESRKRSEKAVTDFARKGYWRDGMDHMMAVLKTV